MAKGVSSRDRNTKVQQLPRLKATWMSVAGPVLPRIGGGNVQLQEGWERRNFNREKDR
jgi:hypothetical protein